MSKKKGLTKKKLTTLLVVGIIGVIAFSIGAGLLLDFAYSAWNANAYSKKVDVSEKEMNEQELLVMSYNIRSPSGDLFGKHRWGIRAPMVLDVIRASLPDILGVQEMQPPQEKHFAKYLKGYGQHVPYRDKGMFPEACGIFYNTKRFELLDKGHFWLSETPEKQSIGWDASMERICSFVKIKDKTNGKEICVFNAHFDHRGPQSRLNSLKLVEKKINEFNAQNVILMGDLNFYETPIDGSEVEEETYIYASKAWTDTKYEAGINIAVAGNTFHGYGEKETELDPPIDFIFYKNDADLIAKTYGVIKTKINGEYPSDHYPVQVTFEYR